MRSKNIDLRIRIKEAGEGEDGLPLYYAYKNDEKVGEQEGYGFDIEADILAQILNKELNLEIQNLKDCYAIIENDKGHKKIDGCRGWSSVLFVLDKLELDWEEYRCHKSRCINIFSKEKN